MLKRKFWHPLVAALTLVALVSQGTWVLAGTTGGLNGTVLDENSAPIQNATITVASPSQVAHTNTDTNGKFSFLSLIPDTYTLSLEKLGYESVSQTGVTIVADTNGTVNFNTRRVIRQIARVTSRAPSSLIKPGTVTDVYSITPAQQDKVNAAGGGGNLNSAWSALSTVPGVYVAPNQQGYIGAGPSLAIRGGNYDQIGYEIDGVPVNRAFDNYPSGPASSLGQQELQVYTGVPPANAEANGLSGFINQVIRTGTYPGFSNIDIGIGGPSFYHKASFEVGGSSPNRNFSYYIGLGGYNQDYRAYDQFNGAAVTNLYGAPITFCDPSNTQAMFPSCYGGKINGVGPNVAGGYNGNTAIGGLVLGPVYGSGNTNGSYMLGAYQLISISSVADRDSVINLHFGLPHKDGTKDDIQLLGMVNYIVNKYYSSTNDQGGVALLNASTLGAPAYFDGYQYNGPTGVLLPGANINTVAQPSTGLYFFPNQATHPFSGASNGFATLIPADQRDGFLNNQGIFKAQYTHNMGSNALLKVYGYTYYSDWLNTSPQADWANFIGCCPGDYELSSRTWGLSGSFIDQINSSNLLNFTGSYTTSNVLRSNNTQFLNGASGTATVNQRTEFVVLVDSTNPTNGLCYNSQGIATTCFPSSSGVPSPANGFGTTAGHANSIAVPNPINPVCVPLTPPAVGCATVNINPLFGTLRQAYQGGLPATPAATCGGGPCQFLVMGNGPYATYNQVTPKFFQGSLTDEWHPSSKLTVNMGVRFDDFQYIGANTSGTAARTQVYNALGLDTCINSSGGTINGIGPGLVADKVRASGYAGAPLGAGQLTPASACPAGFSAFTPVNPTGSPTQTFPNWEPRIGATYTLDPFTVLRASYGRYVQGPNSAFEQYNGLQQNFPYTMYFTYGFSQYGFNSPMHPVKPEASTNYDFSFEHQFKGDTSMKLTPFFRTTQNQINQFFLNQATSFVSGLNVGKQTSQGIELEIDKGNFASQGLSGRLSFTYTNSYINYTPLPNGTTALTPVNAGIASYNAYTSACATGGSLVGRVQFGTPLCGLTVGGATAAPCYTPAGAPDAGCGAGSIANPYWSAPAQPLFDPNGRYAPFSTIPGGIGAAVSAYGAPYVASLVLNERTGKFAFAPVLQFFAGSRYGAPLSTEGIAPDSGCGALAGTVAGDPRYPYGAPAGAPFNALTCGAILTGGIPNSFTKTFDRIGAFAGPSNLLLHMQMTYDVSSKVQLVANLTNIVNTCFGGTKVAWAVTGACGYGVVGAGTSGAVGNLFNPGSVIQPFVATPYEPFFQGLPFSAYINAKIKI